MGRSMNRAGRDFVLQGAYMLLWNEGEKSGTGDDCHWSQTVEEGMLFEIVIMLPLHGIRDSEKCPRCRKHNSRHMFKSNGWITW